MTTDSSSLTLIGLDQVADHLQTVTPLIHGVKVAGGQDVNRLISICGDLERELEGAVVSQGEIKVRPEVDGSLPLLLLPSLVDVLVVVEGGYACLSVVLENEEVGFPVSGGSAVGVQSQLEDTLGAFVKGRVRWLVLLSQ